MKYKIVERFMSLQGEGAHVGTPMYFVRLSQCPVGKVEGICRSWNGDHFVCDTGEAYKSDSKVEHHPYTQVNEELTAEEIWTAAAEHGCNVICVTGGEPLIYDLQPLVDWVDEDMGTHRIHIETSGTVSIPKDISAYCWITMSPKFGYLKENLSRVSELKLLVDHQTDGATLVREFLSEVGRPQALTFVQPIEVARNTEATNLNIKRAIEICLEYPKKFRLSLQTHKFLALR